jgi:hypothetical protein
MDTLPRTTGYPADPAIVARRRRVRLARRLRRDAASPKRKPLWSRRRDAG